MNALTRTRMSPSGRPAYRPPLLPDGSIDVRAWLADLDAHFNAGLDTTPRPLLDEDGAA